MGKGVDIAPGGILVIGVGYHDFRGGCCSSSWFLNRTILFLATPVLRPELKARVGWI